MKHENLCEKALQEWLSAIMHLVSDHHTGHPCVAAENTLQSIRYGVSLVDGILSRITKHDNWGWKVPRSFAAIAEAYYTGEGEKSHATPVVFPTAPNRTRLSYEEFLKGNYALSVDTLKVLQKDGYILLDHPDIRIGLASFKTETEIQASFDTDEWWQTTSAKYRGQVKMPQQIGKYQSFPDAHCMLTIDL